MRPTDIPLEQETQETTKLFRRLSIRSNTPNSLCYRELSSGDQESEPVPYRAFQLGLRRLLLCRRIGRDGEDISLSSIAEPDRPKLTNELHRFFLLFEYGLEMDTGHAHSPNDWMVLLYCMALLY